MDGSSSSIEGPAAAPGAGILGRRRRARRRPGGWPASSRPRWACSTRRRWSGGSAWARTPRTFPDGDASLTAVLASGLLWHGRVSIWRPDRDAGPDLALPAGPPARRPTWWPWSASPPGPAAEPGWGPPCPERALKAWGQSVADGLRGEAFPRPAAAASPFRGEGGDRLLTARLIRRLRVSDPPERFQDLALHALRSALGVAAVAWVPTQPGEPTVVVGEVKGMTAARLPGPGPRRAAPTASSWPTTPAADGARRRPAGRRRRRRRRSRRPAGSSRSTRSTTAPSPPPRSS